MSVIFGDILGLNYDIKFDENIFHWTIQIDNYQIIFNDCFFNTAAEDFEQWDMPDVHYFNSEFNINKDLPILYGKPIYSETKSEIFFQFDLFASAFFMLTRWEEYLSEQNQHKFDSLERFDGKQSIAFLNNFLKRPIVNEYIELLWNILSTKQPTITRKNRNFQVYLSHDVDIPLAYPTFLKKVKHLLGDIIKRKSLTQAFKTLKEQIFDFDDKNDPFNKYDYFMDLSEKIGLKSHFNFMSGGQHKYDFFYDISQKKIQNIINIILSRKHYIGFHPSYNSFHNYDIWQYEYNKLIESTDIIYGGRQHFLRFSMPYTYRLWNESKCVFDSSMGYPHEVGFRCGICYPFYPFDFINKIKLKIIEIPLIVMDNTLIGYKKYTSSQMQTILTNCIDEVTKYNGTFSLLWHNHLILGYEEVYEFTLNYLKEKECLDLHL